mgnify:CR=1 FL=1
MDINWHNHIRWTIRRNGLWSTNHIRKCAYTQNNYRCGSKNVVRLADRSESILSVKNDFYFITFFPNISAILNLINWSNKSLLEIMNSAKQFAITTYFVSLSKSKRPAGALRTKSISSLTRVAIPLIISIVKDRQRSRGWPLRAGKEIKSWALRTTDEVICYLQFRKIVGRNFLITSFSTDQ